MTENSFDAFFNRLEQVTGISSQSELARNLGVHRSSITQAKRKGNIPDSWIFKLATMFFLDPCWLKQGKITELSEKSHGLGMFKNIPKVKARLDAGGGSFEVSSEVQGLYAFRRDWLTRKGNPEQMVLMEVMGDSMEPTIQEGDVVLVDQSQQELYAGRIYALGVEDTVLVKRIEKHPHKLVLISSNPSYSPIYLQGDEIENVRIIGRVIWLCREIQ